MKKRTIMISLVVLGLLLLVGVGFAAWTISNADAVHGKVETANITAYGVTNSSYSLSFDFVTDSTGNTVNASPAIIFGKTSGTATWLTATDVADQNLTVYVKVSVDFAQNLPDTLPISFAFSKTDADSAYTTCTSANLISGPTYKIGSETVTSIAKGDFSAATGEASVVVQINFAWGSALNNSNPFTYFNALDYSTANANAANDALTKIYALNGGSYNFTFGTVE